MRSMRVQNRFQFGEMSLHRELLAQVEGFPAQIVIVIAVLESADHRVREAFHGWRIRRSQLPSHARNQPVWNSAYGKASRGESCRSGFNPNQTEGLGPKAGH